MRGRIMAMAIAAAVCFASSLHAEKPSWAGKGGKSEEMGAQQHSGGKKGSKHDASPTGVSVSIHFGDADRIATRDYFNGLSGAHCPPGLAKKHNDCLPPGQAKKWKIGRRLPGDLVFYDLPVSLLAALKRAPDGHRYVRVASDVLMIAIGTSMVVDAIEDLGRR